MLVLIEATVLNCSDRNVTFDLLVEELNRLLKYKIGIENGIKLIFNSNSYIGPGKTKFRFIDFSNLNLGPFDYWTYNKTFIIQQNLIDIDVNVYPA
ncbi:beta protein [Porcine ephemerovirus 2]|uniref:Beta protein n=1 Tax=Porcine ephemerovirus 2 TaxID=2928257 RepID=A0AAX3A6X8_9RHAB|nr:beta protein [Porcine ephemerovirus 2]UNP42124.1 beta protein [Porcine ephemerovirus 2]